MSEEKNEVTTAANTAIEKPQDDSTIDGMFRMATALSTTSSSMNWSRIRALPRRS